MKKKIGFFLSRFGIYGVIMAGIIFCTPVLMLLAGSIMDASELSNRLYPMIGDTEGYIAWKWIPDFPTLEHYIKLLFFTPEFLKLFWNSIGMVAVILLGQMVVGVPAAWSLAVYRFKGRDFIFSLYVILMLMPFQVTMLSRYLVLDRVNLINTRWSVILPALFSTFPVFLCYRGFRAIPPMLLDAARIDGAGEWKIFVHIGLPLAQGGIYSAIILNFLECYSMIEEPLAYIKDKAVWPLSLYLPEVDLSQAGYYFAASFITLTISLFVFAIFRDSLEQGIVAGALKE